MRSLFTVLGLCFSLASFQSSAVTPHASFEEALKEKEALDKTARSVNEQGIILECGITSDSMAAKIVKHFEEPRFFAITKNTASEFFPGLVVTTQAKSAAIRLPLVCSAVERILTTVESAVVSERALPEEFLILFPNLMLQEYVELAQASIYLGFDPQVPLSAIMEHIFSPTALTTLNKLDGEQFEKRRRNLIAISAVLKPVLDSRVKALLAERMRPFLTEKGLYFSTKPMEVEHTNSVYSVAVSPDNKFLLTGGKNVRLWELPESLFGIPKPLGTFKQGARINTLAFSSDGRFFASGSSDGTVGVFKHEVHAGLLGPYLSPLLTFKPDENRQDEITTVAFSPNGKFLAVKLASESHASVWDLGPWLQKDSPKLKAPNRFPNQTKHFQLMDFVNSLAFCNVNLRFKSPFSNVTASKAAIANNCELLLIASENESVKLWKPSTEQVLSFGDDSRNKSLVFSPDGTLVAVSDEVGKAYKADIFDVGELLSAHDSREVKPIHTFKEKAKINNIAFGQGGTLFATAGEDGKARVWTMFDFAKLSRDLALAQIVAYCMADRKIVTRGQLPEWMRKTLAEEKNHYVDQLLFGPKLKRH